MADVQSRAGRVGEHVKYIILRRKPGGGDGAVQAVPFGERVFGWNCLSRVPGAEGLLSIPKMLPFGLDQMKWILFPHRSESHFARRPDAGQGVWALFFVRRNDALVDQFPKFRADDKQAIALMRMQVVVILVIFSAG